MQVIEQLKEEREDSDRRVSEIEARARLLEKEVATGRESLRTAAHTLLLVSTDLLAANLRADPVILEAFREIQGQSQRLLEQIQREQDASPLGNVRDKKEDAPSGTA
jgi:hypothetical protein